MGTLSNQWYTNKDLFELINKLQKDMSETRTIIKKYNGLYSKLDETKRKVDDVEKKVEHVEAVTEGKKNTKESIQSWGGWIFGLVTLMILIYSTFN